MLSLWPAAYALSYFGVGCTDLETTNWPWDILPLLFNFFRDSVGMLGVANSMIVLGLVILFALILSPLIVLYLIAMPFFLIAQAVGINC